MSVESALVLCRFIHFTALIAWFGRMLYVCVIARPGITPRIAHRLTAQTRQATRWLGALTLLSACAWVPVQTAEMSGGWDDAWQPDLWLAVLDTPFGTVWRWRLLIALATLLLTWVEPRGATRSLPSDLPRDACALPDKAGAQRIACLTLSGTGILLATLGLEGHAAMLCGWAGGLQRANHALHLLSTAAWAGMLPMLLCTLPLLDAGDDQARRTLRRFSTAGHIAVALAVATGVANIAWILGAVPWHGAASSAPYRDGLMSKCLLVAVMIGIALVNRYGIVPAMQLRQQTHPHARASDAARLGRLQNAFRALTWIEIGVALIVIVLVSHFATLDPQ
ncbi:copper homeostasis membrane protein CopD [Robbsia sp. KACC 23696]|uniref:copper homeostasis membrane protein CopD n=1 Tax=Robbsia sp. KACC 23696 TaxID=3149231 RepID=UPI00325BE74F